MPAQPQRLANGRYAVHGVLGEGAQGITYDASSVDGRRVAIKRFDVRGAKGWKDVELAEREARVLATLDHPLLPRYIEHFEEDGALYLVMEKVEGETLEALRQRHGALPEDEVRRFLACADRALSYLHGRGSPVVHRDVKPRNVIRRPSGDYVLVDFGAVSELLFRRGASTVVGTIGYMAPEQLQGRALPATDVYAVGATAVAALSGREPDSLPHQGLRVDVRAALAGRASAEMIASLERMLEPDPERRPMSIGAALDTTRSSFHPGPAPGVRPVAVEAEVAREDAMVKSIRKLLWLLWGLSWVIVPPMLDQLGLSNLIPIIMFGSLAGLFILVWHKGALIRAAMRVAMGRRTGLTGVGQLSEVGAKKRIEVGTDQRVRVHSAELAAEDVVGRTEVGTTIDQRRRAR